MKLPVSWSDIGLLYFAYRNIGFSTGTLKVREVGESFTTHCDKNAVSAAIKRLVKHGYLVISEPINHDTNGVFTPMKYSLSKKALDLFCQI